MQSIVNAFGMLRELAQRLVPYLMVEMLLPGGTLIVLALLLVRRRMQARQGLSTACLH